VWQWLVYRFGWFVRWCWLEMSYLLLLDDAEEEAVLYVGMEWYTCDVGIHMMIADTTWSRMKMWKPRMFPLFK
jgi:hypothetical protein